jgi:hypothetical protein
MTELVGLLGLKLRMKPMQVLFNFMFSVACCLLFSYISAMLLICLTCYFSGENEMKFFSIT